MAHGSTCNYYDPSPGPVTQSRLVGQSACLPHHWPVEFTHLGFTRGIQTCMLPCERPRFLTNTTNASTSQHADSLQIICSDCTLRQIVLPSTSTSKHDLAALPTLIRNLAGNVTTIYEIVKLNPRI
jgi:hypothetical protein